jgi:hypothetical protein
MLELDASEPELGERPPGDNLDDLTADPAPTLPGNYPAAVPLGVLARSSRAGFRRRAASW